VKSKQFIITGQMRIRLDPLNQDGVAIDAKVLASVARQWIHDQLGTSRVKPGAPKLGRGEDDGTVPAFCYGTFDFAFEMPVGANRRGRSPAARPQPATTVPVAMGKTKKRVATGKTKKLRGTP
jgi:hypothetical protein